MIRSNLKASAGALLAQPELKQILTSAGSYTVTEPGTYLYLALGRPATATNSTGTTIFNDSVTGNYDRTFIVSIATLDANDTITFTGSNKPIFAVYKLTSDQVAASYTKIVGGMGENISKAKATCVSSSKYLFLGIADIGDVAISGYNVEGPQGVTDQLVSAEYVASYDGDYTKIVCSTEAWNVPASMALSF